MNQGNTSPSSIIHDSLFMSQFRKGFTLIELLITIAVIGILAIGALVLIDPIAQMQKARDATRKSDLGQIQKALQVYYQDSGEFPASSPDYRIVGLDADATIVNWDDPWLPYMAKVPKDPAGSSKKYVYFTTSDRQRYYLYATLDRGGKDPQACKPDGSACGSLSDNGTSQIPPTVCGGTCNYGVSSSNVTP